MILTTASDIIRVEYGAATAVDLDFQTGWADQTTTAFTPGRTNTNGTTAGGATVTIVASPAGSTQRQVKTIVEVVMYGGGGGGGGGNGHNAGLGGASGTGGVGAKYIFTY